MNSSSLMMGMFSSCAFLFFDDIEAVSLLIRKLVDLLTLPVTFPPLAFDVGFQFVAVFVMVDVARDDKRQFVATCSRRLRFLLLHVQKVEQAADALLAASWNQPTTAADFSGPMPSMCAKNSVSSVVAASVAVAMPWPCRSAVLTSRLLIYRR